MVETMLGLALKAGMTEPQKLLLILAITVAGIVGMWMRLYRQGTEKRGQKDQKGRKRQREEDESSPGEG